MVKTKEEILAFYKQCKKFWVERVGCTEAEAESRALWWDCVEAWDFDKSWTDVKRNFVDSLKDCVPKPKED